MGMKSGSRVNLWGDATRAPEDPEAPHLHLADTRLAVQHEQKYVRGT
jgi:hypothetical protein